MLLTWAEAIDPDPASGTDHYEIWYRRNDGAWVIAADDLRDLSYIFRGAENGGRYAFQVRAVDRAGNTEPLGPAEAQTLVDMSPPVAVVDPLPAFVRSPFTVSWHGRDEPSGPNLFASGILYYDVHYKVDGHGWYDLWMGITTTSHDFENGEDGRTYEFMVVAQDLAGNWDPWGEAEASTRVDVRAPGVAFGPVPPTASPTFTVSWTGDDWGGSGTTSYDIQFRVDLGPWQDWFLNTQQVSATYTGTTGHVYCFRGRAKDVVGNQGQYPPDPGRCVGVLDPATLKYKAILPVLGVP
jgi:hypothetical protein